MFRTPREVNFNSRGDRNLFFVKGVPGIMSLQKKKWSDRGKKRSVAILLEWLHSQYWLAKLSGASPWRYALELPRLLQRGINEKLLHELFEEGLIEHGIETTKDGAKRRVRRCQETPWQERSCFVLTKAGLKEAIALVPEAVEEESRPSMKKRRKPLVPRYDAETRELWFGEKRLARFPVHGSYTTSILEAFEMAKWTQKEIDNPLPGHDEAVRTARLRGAVRNLNRDVHSILFEVSRGGGKLRWLRTQEWKE